MREGDPAIGRRECHLAVRRLVRDDRNDDVGRTGSAATVAHGEAELVRTATGGAGRIEELTILDGERALARIAGDVRVERVAIRIRAREGDCRLGAGVNDN